MKKFQEYLFEGIKDKKGFKDVEAAIATLAKAADPKSRLSKLVQAELGPGYAKDFAEMRNYVEKINIILDEIKRDLD